MTILPYDPGVLPTLPAPIKGEWIAFEVEGLPPYKEIRRSIRNIKHPRYDSFVALRAAATRAMAGRAWYFDAVGLDVTIYAPKLHDKLSLSDYVSGIEDTLDGSCGFTFTYLPIVYQDDSQIVKCQSRFVRAENSRYTVRVQFLSREDFVARTASIDDLVPPFDRSSSD